MEQLSLLGSPKISSERALPAGAQYVPDFVTAHEEATLLAAIDDSPWLNDLRRRVQHYGYKYDYRKRELADDDYLGDLPSWANLIGSRLILSGYFQESPDQVIVNEYLPGQGIASHIDRDTCFGAVVASLSLASPTVMDFDLRSEHREVVLEPRSLIVLTGPARYAWRHGIAARKRDILDGFTRERSRRVSLTFRTTR